MKDNISREEILRKLNSVFCDVFDDDTLVITENTTADDIDDWDSLAQITLIAAIEKEFGVRFDVKTALTLKKISEIIDSCGGDMLRTAAYLKQLYELSVISVENVDTVCRFSLPDWFRSCGKAAEIEENLTEEKVEVVENTGKSECHEPAAAPVEELAGEPEKSAWDELAEQSSRRGKSGKIVLFILLLAIAAAIITFIYYRGLI